MSRWLRLALAAGVLSAAAPAAADEAPARRFGDAGQLVLTADRLVPVASYTVQTLTVVEGDTTTTTTDASASFAMLVGREAALGSIHSVPRVAADLTVAPRVTIGAGLALAFGLEGARVSDRETKGGPRTRRENALPGATLLGFAPRVGYVLPLGERLAFWPRAGVAFYSLSAEREQTSNVGVTSRATVTDTLFAVDLDPQLVWTPLPHVLVHAGPLASLPLTGTHDTAFEQGSEQKDRSDHLTVFRLGLQAGLGAWFDL